MTDQTVTYRRCGYAGCDWGHYVIEDSGPSVGIYYIALDGHLKDRHDGKSAPASVDAFARLFGGRP